MKQRVETLEQSQRQNPLSIDLVVNSAKRFLAKPEYRIQLDELITREVDQLIAQIDTEEFTPTGPWNQDDFRTRVQRYEAVTEVLLSMAGVLGRWGNDNELPLVLDVIRSLHAHAAKTHNGLTAFLEIRSYPAMLVFTSYGLGLTRAERWSSLHRLFDATIDRQDGEPVRAVEVLTPAIWKGAGNNIWKQIEGLDRKHTPLSDHLLTLFQEWSNRFMGLTPDFELLFERFEMLGSLAHLERTDKSEIMANLAADPQQNWTWMPVGRSGWHSSYAEKVIAEIQSQPMQKALISAGFGKGYAPFISLFIQNFKLLSARMNW